MRLSKEFNLGEYLHSETADKYGIREQYYPDIIVKRNLRYLHERLIVKVMEQLPAEYHLRINSGYRCDAVNNKLKGSKTSEHLIGMAADIECWSDKIEENEIILRLFDAYDFEFTQCISEKGKDFYHPNWVHLSYNTDNLKKQVIRLV
jgi:hypothetical protein